MTRVSFLLWRPRAKRSLVENTPYKVIECSTMNKILVVQFRTDQSLPQEQRCIVDTVGEEVAKRLNFVNAVSDDLSSEILENVSHVILGGSGEFFLGEGAGKDSWLPKVFLFVEKIYAKNIPVFGICFGHQILLSHAGAKVCKIPEMSEIGTFPVAMRKLSSSDELFGGFPEKYDGIFAHKETPIEVPDHVRVLGSTERVEAGVVRIGARRAWGVMFHPDMNMMSVRERFSMFPHYADNPEKFAQALAAFREAPVAPEILKKFVSL